MRPDLGVQWFTPRSWTTPVCQLDLCVGGTCRTTLRSPAGQKLPNVDIFLAIVPIEGLVFTDAYLGDWQPNLDHFFTAVLTFESLSNGKARCIARARH